MESHGENKMSAPIALPLERASRLLGRDISQKEATGILMALDFAVSVKGKGESAVLTVTPPLHRIGDIHGEADLIEEIARITGFASFSEELPNVSLHIPPRDDRRDRVRDALRREGFCETVQLSFVGKEFLEKAKMSFGDEGQTRLRTIENPLGEDMRFLRPSLLPALLDAAERNAKTEREHLRLFEVGHVFSFGKERSALCLVELHYDPQMKELPLLSLKAALSSAARGINLRLTFKRLASAASWMHPGRAAEIRLNDVVIGTVFELHPDVLAAFDLPPRSAAAELNLDLLFAGRSSTRLYQPPFAFPSVTYDVTVTLDPLTEAEALLTKVRGAHPFLREITLIDLFEREGRRNITFRCVYNAGDRTLTEEEVKPIHEKVEKSLQQ
jgi:phenylalanyl-tRNA synthetase beta chain